MKPAAILRAPLIAALLLLSQCVSTQPAQTRTGAEREVRAAEHARREAILRNDTAALDRLIADSFVATLDAGDVKTKADELAVNRAGDRRVEGWDASDVVVRPYGDTVLVTGRAAVSDALRDQATRNFTFRYTHVWARLDGRWQLVARHISGRRLIAGPQGEKPGLAVSSAEAELRRVDLRLAEVAQSGSAEAMEAVLHSAYVAHLPNGQLSNHTQAMAFVATGSLAKERFQRTQQSVIIHGDTGIVMGFDKMESPPPLADKGQLTRRFTNVYVRHEGSWKLVARHFHFIP